MPKNIVVCADGTGNKFSDENTNVVRLYQCLDLRDPARQVAYYHGGVGTLGQPEMFGQWGRRWTRLKGLAFAYGLSSAIGDIYEFLMECFEEGDRLFLFGFSRGAYTVRALAGMLHFLGLVRRGDNNLIDYGTQMLKDRKTTESFRVAQRFKDTFSRECKPWFIGVWDTVASVGWIWDPLHLPYTAHNPDLSVGRHAVSIDERRCYYRPNLWGAASPGQDIKQVWFSGVHCDVGGGYPDTESGLSRISLEWMLVEAARFGLSIDRKAASEMIAGSGSDVKPAPLHNSLSDSWLLLEPLPHVYFDVRCHPPERKIKFPLGERRTIEPQSTVHESVLARMEDKATKYNPPNLPKDRKIEPRVRWDNFGAGAPA